MYKIYYTGVNGFPDPNTVGPSFRTPEEAFKFIPERARYQGLPEERYSVVEVIPIKKVEKVISVPTVVTTYERVE